METNKKKKKRYNKTKKMSKKIKPRRKKGVLFFSIMSDFTPNLTPNKCLKWVALVEHIGDQLSLNILKQF